MNADCVMPVMIFLVLQAQIPHLGAEIALLEDLMGSDYDEAMMGYAGYCFTTLKVICIAIVIFCSN